LTSRLAASGLAHEHLTIRRTSNALLAYSDQRVAFDEQDADWTLSVASMSGNASPGLTITYDADARRIRMSREWMGTVPLYYRWRQEALEVSTSPLLLRRPGEAPSWQSIAEVVGHSHFDDEASLFSDVCAVPQGGTVEVGVMTGRIDRRTPSLTPPPAFYTPNAAGRVRERIKESLARTGATAVFVSGGLDSTYLAGHMRRPFEMYCLAFPGFACDESAWVEAVQAHLQVPLKLVEAQAIDLDVPRGDMIPMPNVEMLRPLLRMARADGHQKVLMGLGADQIFGGTLRDRWQASALKDKAYTLTRLGPRRALRLLLSQSHPSLPTWLTADAVEACRVAHAKRLQRLPGPPSWRLLWQHQLGSQLAFSMLEASRLGAEEGLELCFPFLDEALVRCVWSAPPSERLGRPGTPTKPLLRTAHPGPAAVRNRTGKVVFDEYLESATMATQRRLLESMAQGRLVAMGVVDPRRWAVRSRTEHFRTNLAIGVETWLRKLWT